MLTNLRRRPPASSLFDRFIIVIIIYSLSGRTAAELNRLVRRPSTCLVYPPPDLWRCGGVNERSYPSSSLSSSELFFFIRRTRPRILIKLVSDFIRRLGPGGEQGHKSGSCSGPLPRCEALDPVSCLVLRMKGWAENSSESSLLSCTEAAGEYGDPRRDVYYVFTWLNYDTVKLGLCGKM